MQYELPHPMIATAPVTAIRAQPGTDGEKVSATIPPTQAKGALKIPVAKHFFERTSSGEPLCISLVKNMQPFITAICSWYERGVPSECRMDIASQ